MALGNLVGATLVCHFEYQLMILVYFFSQGPGGSGLADKCIIWQAMRNPGGRVCFVYLGYLTQIHNSYASSNVDLPMEIDDKYWENEHEPN